MGLPRERPGKHLGAPLPIPLLEVELAKKLKPYHLVYGNSMTIPTSLTNEPEPQCKYSDYQYEIKRQMQASQELARNHLWKAEEKSKEYYDRNSNDRILT